MFEPYIARVLDALALDPVLEGRVRDFLRRELPRRRRELGLDPESHGFGSGSGLGPGSGTSSATTAAPRVPAEEFACLLFIPVGGSFVFYAIGAAVLILLTAATAITFKSVGSLIFLVPIVFTLARRTFQPFRDAVRVDAGQIHYKKQICHIAAVERLRLETGHLFSAPLLIEYSGGRISLKRSHPGALATASQLVRHLEGLIAIDPAVKDWLARAPLPLERTLLWARWLRLGMIVMALLLLGVALFIARHGLSLLFTLIPLPFAAYVLGPVFLGAIRNEIKMLYFLSIYPAAILAVTPFWALFMGYDHVAIYALLGLSGLYLFHGLTPAFVTSMRWPRLIPPAVLTAASVLVIGNAMHRALPPAERVGGVDGQMIRLGVAIGNERFVFTATQHHPKGDASADDDQPHVTTVYDWRADGAPRPIAHISHPQLSIPIWLRDSQEVAFSTPGPDGFMTLRFVHVPSGEERAVDMLYESPRRAFIGLTPYQLSPEGSHVWLTEKIDNQTTRYTVRRVSDSRDLWSAPGATGPVNAPGLSHLDWENGHTALVLHYQRTDDVLPGYPPGEPVLRDAAIVRHEFSAGTSATLALLPAPVVKFRLFRRQGFLLALTAAHELLITDVATGDSRVHPNAFNILPPAIGRCQWARGEGALYTLTASTGRPDEPYGDAPLDHLIHLDPATGAQSLVWRADEPIREAWVPPDGRHFLIVKEAPVRPFGHGAVNYYALDAATGRLRRLGSAGVGKTHLFASTDAALDMPLAEYPRAWIVPHLSVRFRPLTLLAALLRHPNPFTREPD